MNTNDIADLVLELYERGLRATVTVSEDGEVSIAYDIETSDIDFTGHIQPPSQNVMPEPWNPNPLTPWNTIDVTFERVELPSDQILCAPDDDSIMGNNGNPSLDNIPGRSTPCTDPDKMNGAGDQFLGSDFE